MTFIYHGPETKFCKNCVYAKINLLDWLIGSFSYKFAKCTHKNSIIKDADKHESNYLATGKYLKKDIQYTYCSIMRIDYLKLFCGKEAKYFLPKRVIIK